MANRDIPSYTEKTTLTGAEQLEISDGGTTKKALASSIGKLFKGSAGTAIASAATTDIGAATGVYVHITGSTGPITSLGSTTPGQFRIVIFDSTPTLTHHSTNLVLPGGANITARAGDCAIFESEGDGAGGAGSRWKCVAFCRADGTPIKSGALSGQDKSADYTFVLADANTVVRHPSADTTGRTFTVPSNASVPFPRYTMITVVNQNGAGNIGLAVTSDTLRWSPTGATGGRVLAANGVANFFKIDDTEWLLTGTGIT